MRAAGTGQWDPVAMRRDHAAGGGTGEAFDAAWAQLHAWAAEDAAAFAAGTFGRGGGGLHYIVAGRKPVEAAGA
jgi:hypothetical protein